ncbi:hypothetical protein E3V33_06075 [Candidatus Marinimicrobia bacterium MT.SAG.4]|nr:hypothetical protein E3V33_06075 [Candidatus Marinimicrobia bacterium MT.SAG.4]
MNKAKQEIKNSEVSEIWLYGRGFYKCYIENLDVVKLIMRWSSVERCSIYYTSSMRIFAYDFVFPTPTYNRVAKALGMPMKSKSIKRVIQGQRLHEVDRIAQFKSSILSSEAVLK